MKQKTKWAFFIAALVFVGVSLEAQSKALNDYIASFNNEMSKQETFTFTGCYESGQPGIEEISLYYSSISPQELDLAREQFLNFVDQFLEGLNENLRLKTQLKPYPFSAKGLDIVIFFRNKKGKYATSPNIGQISMKGGVITYYKFTQGEFKMVKQENYSTAEKLMAKVRRL